MTGGRASKTAFPGRTRERENAPDDRTRKIAISRIEALGGKVIITPDGAVKIQLPERD